MSVSLAIRQEPLGSRPAHSQGGAAPLDPTLQPGVDAVLDALGVREILDALSPGELRAVLAEIRVTLLHGARLAFSATRTLGWSFDDPALLQFAGDTSAGFAIACKQMVVPRLAGLATRMEAGGAFLDVGTGVGAFAIAMARQWPTLRVVGVDVWAPLCPECSARCAPAVGYSWRWPIQGRTRLVRPSHRHGRLCGADPRSQRQTRSGGWRRRASSGR